ncbi:methyltransferase domain-containing protein [Halomonas campisalis]|uniref:Small RNA 2'-O-methyltransferase n=1 Tax=Billgrantia campisalis TaxID=74661 RepID=A0ABS9P8T9_9GAMM|nr:methyltransferase domain-containing protein [Halomonas campisalis]MCG6658173.1 methyltransferase domain-containing protein [Halomonas campisalis]MDR5862842.1 methyltransferase domain-containing protein [Halomonas campisalis]
MSDIEAPDLHQERLRCVAGMLVASGARRVLDLGCGTGTLLQYLLREPQFERLVGLELSGELLAQAKLRLAAPGAAVAARLELICGSYAERHPRLTGFEAAAMVETIEHVPPEALSRVERAVFDGLRPGLLVMTTPNREFNPLFGLAPGEFREPDHKFEWDRARFRDWARGVARRNGYRVALSGIGEWHPRLGQPTQLARFSLKRSAPAD